MYDAAWLSERQRELVAGFVRKVRTLVFSGVWCGDCAQQCPLIQRIVEANPEKMDLRFFAHAPEGELDPDLRMNGGSRVPVFSSFRKMGGGAALLETAL